MSPESSGRERLVARKLKLTRQALQAFVESYPCGDWEGLLHEDGCPGVGLRREERDPLDPCRCDGDYRASLVKQALPRLAKDGRRKP